MISADSLTWVREGWVDYINPQVYWEFGNEAADYETLAKWWAGAVEGTGVALYIGEAAYKATRSEEHTSELQSRGHLVCRLLLEKKKESEVARGQAVNDRRYVDRGVDERSAEGGVVRTA